MNSESLAERIGLSALVKVIRSAKNEISERSTDTVRTGTGFTKNERIIKGIYSLINSTWSEYIADEVIDQYNRTYRRSAKLFSRLSNIPEMATAKQLIADSIARMTLGTRAGFENVQALFRNTQQAIVEDSVLSRSLAEELASGKGTPRSLAKVITSDLYQHIEKGQVIVINGRHYQPDKYAEIVARTRTREAQSAAAIDLIKSIGEDLVKVSSHNTHTPLCQIYEGKVFSISGTHPKYPVLDAIAPFHPQCQHVVTPFIEA